MSITGRWSHISSQHLERCCFAGSVDTEKTEALALVNTDRNPVYCQMPLSRQSFSVQLPTHRKQRFPALQNSISVCQSAEKQ